MQLKKKTNFDTIYLSIPKKQKILNVFLSSTMYIIFYNYAGLVNHFKDILYNQLISNDNYPTSPYSKLSNSFCLVQYFFNALFYLYHVVYSIFYTSGFRVDE